MTVILAVKLLVAVVVDESAVVIVDALVVESSAAAVLDAAAVKVGAVLDVVVFEVDDAAALDVVVVEAGCVAVYDAAIAFPSVLLLCWQLRFFMHNHLLHLRSSPRNIIPVNPRFHLRVR